MHDTPSFDDLLARYASSDDATLGKYAAALEKMLTAHGATPEFRARPATLEAYLGLAPRFTAACPRLTGLIAAQGWKPGTYKQYHGNGRRLIEHASGALAARAEVRTREDEWTTVLDRAQSLAAAKLLSKRELSDLRTLVLACRRRGLLPADLNQTTAQDLLDGADTYEARKVLKRGAACLDWLRTMPTMHNLLPHTPIGALETATRRVEPIADHLAAEAAAWIDTATTEIPEFLQTEHGIEVFKTEHSDGSRGIFAAALNRYIRTVTHLSGNAPSGDLLSLFPAVSIETVLASWIAETASGARHALSTRSLYSYVDKLRLILLRNGHLDRAEKVKAMRDGHALLREGRVLSEFMSAGTETWCRALIDDEEKTRLFELQHILYWEQARAALDAAKNEGFDLARLSCPTAMRRLPRRERARAKELLRRARMFGVCAAYAAIGREGVPFRKTNMLGLCRGGPCPTFFDHAQSSAPRFVVQVPNELLKNGDTLTRRNKSIPPISFMPGEEGAFGFDILTFFFESIRPLFPGAAKSHFLFPGLRAADAQINPKTFDSWLRTCSTEIGLPMTSHNFRHGEASVMINDDPSSIEIIALSLGDLPDTVRRYYAFLHPEKTLREMQKKRNARRAAALAQRDTAQAA